MNNPSTSEIAMDFDELAEHLNDLHECRESDLRDIAFDQRADLSRRIAAILCLCSLDHVIHAAATDIIVKVTVGDKEEAYPLRTPFGRAMAEAVRLSRAKLIASCEDDARTGWMRLVAPIILAVDRGEAFNNPSTENIARQMSGRDVAWWTDWIRREREGLGNSPETEGGT